MKNNGLNNVSDTDLRSALEDANIPTLLMVLTQITGDMDHLTGGQLPSRSVDGVSKMSPERQSQIKSQAFDVLRELRDSVREIAPLPDSNILREMLSIFVNEEVQAEYVPMFLEDMGFVSSIDTHIKWRKTPKKMDIEAYEVVIIGAGISGISAAIHLKHAGIPFTIIEKNDNVGGTWYENDYPACGVDTPNHFYSYSFEPNNEWSAYYSKRDELFSYLKGVAEKYGILEHIQFNKQVKTSTYNEEAKNWTLTVQNKKGQEEVLTPKFILSAVGQLNRPKTPNFSGKDSFKGDAFHSANWRHDVDLTGKHVAVIGTGASAMQLCPEIAKQAGHLTILQRSPHWIRILPDYHKTVSDGKKWLLAHLPFYQNWYRFKLFWSYGDGIWNSIHMDPKWPHLDRSANAENDRHRNIYIQNLSDALGGDETLLKKVTPDYPPFAKRMLIDNHWCRMLRQDNVSLETAGISKITENSVIDDQGGRHEVDVIIYATGYEAGDLLSPMRITGRAGKELRSSWGNDARAYLGMTAPDFPNFFMFYGPNTNLAHGGSLIFHVECQSRYITKCIMRMIEEGHGELEVRKDVHDTYNEKVDAENNSLVWSHPKVDNWYKNSEGRIVSVSPWRLVDYWTMTYETEMTDFKLSS